MNSESDKLFMGLAMELAHTAYENNEVPVGAVVVQNRNAEILAAFSNQMRSTGSSLAHAEMLALQKSMEVINNSISNSNIQMEWLEFNPDSKVGKILSSPERIQIPENINEQLIVELYSK